MATQADTTYQAEASACDIAVDWQLADIRKQQDRHEITAKEAADLRVAVLEAHLDKIKTLRVKYWGDSNDE